MSLELLSCPPCLLKIGDLKHTTFKWENLRGKGLPDGSGIEWNAIVWFFQNGYADKDAKREIAAYFNTDTTNFSNKLHRDLKRQNNGNLPDHVRLIKQKRPKTKDPSKASLTTPVAEGSPPLPDGASARPRPPPTRRGRLPDDPARRWAGGGAEACGGGAQGPPAPRASAPPAAATPSQIDAAHAALSYSHGCGAPRGHCLPIYPLGTFRAA